MVTDRRTMDERRVALVTGANKGIGFETVRSLARRGCCLLLGARDMSLGESAAARLRDEGLDVRFLQIDVTEAESVASAARIVDEKFGRLDILVNNAGINAAGRATASTSPLEDVRRTYQVNVFGVIAVTNAFLPLLRKAGRSARIVNVSSGTGSFFHHADRFSLYASVTAAAYVSSKAALNMVTVMYAQELESTGIKVNAADPGFTATDLNGNRGTQTPAEGADSSVKLATLPDDGPTGGFFDRYGRLPW